MARTTTLLQFRDRIRNLAEVRTIYVSDTELDEEINQSIAELYDKLVAASSDYYESTNNVTIVSGTSSYALPSDYYRTIGVDVLRTDSTWTNLDRYNLAERNFDQDSTAGNDRDYTKYRIRGTNMVLVPTPNWSETNGIRHLYIPAPTRLVTNSDTFDGIAGWEDWVVFDCCVKIVGGKEEGDASQFERLMGKLEARIQTMAHVRDASEPDTIRNVEEEYKQKLPRYGKSV